MSQPFTPIDVHELNRRRTDGWDPYVLDVRGQAEADEVSFTFVDRLQPHTSVGAIAGELPKDRDIVVHCRSGGRSAMAAQVLASHGFTRLYNLEGGMMAWEREIGTDLKHG